MKARGMTLNLRGKRRNIRTQGVWWKSIVRNFLLGATVLAVAGCMNPPGEVECFIADVPTMYLENVNNFRIKSDGIVEISNREGLWYYKLKAGEFCRAN